MEVRNRLRASGVAIRLVSAEPSMRRAMSALALACTSDWAFSVTLGVVAFRDAGATGVGLVALARMVPSAIATPVLTAVADRTRRERFLAVATGIHAIAIGATAILLATGTALVPVYALAIVATVATTVYRPAHSALLPALCTTTSELTSANVVTGLVAALATLLGPVIAGVLLAVAEPAAVLFVAAGFSTAAAVSLVAIRYEAAARISTDRPRFIRESLDGLAAVASHTDLRLVFGMTFAQTCVRGALNVFTVVVAFDLVEAGESGVAALAAALGVGGVVGSIAGSLLVGSRRLGRWFAGGLVLWGAPIAVMATTSSLAAAFALVAVVGLANSVIDVPIFTLPVRLVPDAVLARAFGVLESLVALGVAVGSALTPVLIAGLGLRGALVAAGLLLPAVALVGWARLSGLDAQLAVRDDEISVLRATPMFALLPVPAIEHLAARLDRVMVPAGTVVFEQGEPGASVCIIVSGEADVVGDGALVGRAGPGECFGEIALLQDRPRSATVRARTDLELLDVDRDTFLGAVGAHGHSRHAAESLVAARLAAFSPGGGASTTLTG